MERQKRCPAGGFRSGGTQTSRQSWRHGGWGCTLETTKFRTSLGSSFRTSRYPSLPPPFLPPPPSPSPRALQLNWRESTAMQHDERLEERQSCNDHIADSDIVISYFPLFAAVHQQSICFLFAGQWHQPRWRAHASLHHFHGSAPAQRQRRHW